MTTNEIKDFLLLCVIINYVFLCIWAGVFMLAHDWMYRLHSHWFKISVETFDAIHYAGLAIYKIIVIVFNLGPLIALWIVF
ncbi:MAG: hypothetical protein PHN98_04685 [Smithellaceae bacterium]|jgi:hypothetical protein|nr:hypothetical protein [Smithellaceae bacterium]